MGAEFTCQTVKAKRSELNSIHDSLVKQAQYDYGHSGYSGSFAESPGLTVTDKEFTTENEAENYICDNAQKWENSLAVKILNKDLWVIGGWFSS